MDSHRPNPSTDTSAAESFDSMSLAVAVASEGHRLLTSWGREPQRFPLCCRGQSTASCKWAGETAQLSRNPQGHGGEGVKTAHQSQIRCNSVSEK